MARRKVLKAVVSNFLSTYMSRYSDYNGSWLFGYLVADLNSVEFDLLGSYDIAVVTPAPIRIGNTVAEVLQPRYGRYDRHKTTPLDVARWLAADRFTDQLAKAGLNLSRVREARVRITRLQAREHPRPDPQFWWTCRVGYDVEFRATVVADNGKVYEREGVVWVAPY